MYRPFNPSRNIYVDVLRAQRVNKAITRNFDFRIFKNKDFLPDFIYNSPISVSVKTASFSPISFSAGVVVVVEVGS